MTRDEVESLAKSVLEQLYKENKSKGLLAVYLWGSIITPDFSPESSDVDAVGILSDEADFKEFNKMREWLPSLEPRLNRLQINFFYLSELMGAPVRSNLARLASTEQAVFDFPHWHYVCGHKISRSDLPKVTPQQALRQQIKLTKIRMGWVKDNTYGDMSPEYFCKSLVWLCYEIQNLDLPPGPFSWKTLKSTANHETKELVNVLSDLKSKHWDKGAIGIKSPWLMKKAKTLSKKYS